MKKIPLRKCVVTGERFPKKELVRVVRTPEGSVLVDLTGKCNGHGAYIHVTPETIAKAKKTNVLARALECAIPEEVYDNLEKLIQ